MFTLPSAWNLVISTIVFVIAARYLHRYLEAQGIPKGLSRGMMVFILAYAASWGSGEMVDWVQEKIEGPQPQAVAQPSDEMTQLLKALGQAQSSAELKDPGSN